MSREYPCIYFEEGCVCKKFSDDTALSYCVMGPCPEQVLSNADRIRAMDDEQLAEFLCEFRFCDNAFHPCDNCKGEPYCREGYNGMIDWLQQPAGEDTDEH